MKTIITLDSHNFENQYFGCARVEIIHDNQLKEAKIVSIKSLLEALTHSSVRETSFSRIGQLPYGYYDGNLFVDPEGKINGKFIIILQKSQQVISFEKTRYDNVCTPALLFYYTIVDARISNTRVYAVKGEKWNEQTVLYNYPFGNVETGSGMVCWGSNSLGVVKSLKQLEVITSIFLQSPCNMDYYSGSTASKKKFQSLREFLAYLQTVENFPDSILVKQKGGKNIGNLIREFQ